MSYLLTSPSYKPSHMPLPNSQPIWITLLSMSRVYALYILVIATPAILIAVKGLPSYCYASQQTYVKVNDTYSEGGTHEETLRPQSKARVMNKRRGDKVTIKQIADS